MTGVTAARAVDAVGLSAGQRVLIHGGAGGVGSIAVQLAKRHGAHVIATASADNLEFVRSLGADEVLDYAAVAFETTLRDLDAVIDTVGGDVLERSFRVLKPGGILVTTAGQPDAAVAEQRGVRVATPNQQAPARPILDELGRLAASGEIKVPVAEIYPWHRVAEAHAAAQTGHGRGRRVLVIG